MYNKKGQYNITTKSYRSYTCNVQNRVPLQLATYLGVGFFDWNNVICCCFQSKVNSSSEEFCKIRLREKFVRLRYFSLDILSLFVYL